MNDKSRGKAAATYFVNAADLGITSPEVSDDIVINRFASFCEAIAIHQIDLPRGILLLLAPDIRPELGAIYFYDRASRKFYDLSFEQGVEYDIGSEEFRQLVAEYGLKSLAEGSQTTYLGELLFETLLAKPSQEAAWEVATVWSRTQPPRRHSDELDS
jgi:hypothetical protein